jgi:hypothetical protein
MDFTFFDIDIDIDVDVTRRSRRRGDARLACAFSLPRTRQDRLGHQLFGSGVYGRPRRHRRLPVGESPVSRTLGPEASLVRTCCSWLDVFVADHRRRIQPPSGSLIEDGLLDPSSRPRMGGRRVAALAHGACGKLLLGKAVRRGR